MHNDLRDAKSPWVCGCHSYLPNSFLVVLWTQTNKRPLTSTPQSSVSQRDCLTRPRPRGAKGVLHWTTSDTYASCDVAFVCHSLTSSCSQWSEVDHLLLLNTFFSVKQFSFSKKKTSAHRCR